MASRMSMGDLDPEYIVRRFKKLGIDVSKEMNLDDLKVRNFDDTASEITAAQKVREEFLKDE